jgi:hypothetical protein
VINVNKTLVAIGALAIVGGGISPIAVAEPDGPGGPGNPGHCYDVYNEYEAGPLTVYQYSSCSYDAE